MSIPSLTWEAPFNLAFYSIQKVQFGIVVVHSSVNCFVDCAYPKGFNYAFMSYGLFIALLFTNFYFQSYKNQAPKAKQNGHAHQSNNNKNK